MTVIQLEEQEKFTNLPPVNIGNIQVLPNRTFELVSSLVLANKQPCLYQLTYHTSSSTTPSCNAHLNSMNVHMCISSNGSVRTHVHKSERIDTYSILIFKIIYKRSSDGVQEGGSEQLEVMEV